MNRNYAFNINNNINFSKSEKLQRIGVEEIVYPNLSRVPNPTNLSYMEEDLDASDDDGRRQ